MDGNVMKKVGRTVSILMGISMSFFLSLTGTLTSGHFTIPAWIISFVISTVISLVIGFVIPMKLLNDKITGALKLKPFSIPAKLTESFVSDLIYTPILTFCMVFFAYEQATCHGAPAESMNLGRMFFGSFCICFVVGFVLILILMPVFVKFAMKKNGVNPGQRPEGK